MPGIDLLFPPFRVINTLPKGKTHFRKTEENKMITYTQALSRAKAAKSDWNEEERISKAIITWADSDWEYETEVENDGMEDAEFEAWVKEDAKELAAEDAAKEDTTCEEILRIDFEYEAIDDDARFAEDYEAACEFEWECRTGR